MNRKRHILLAVAGLAASCCCFAQVSSKLTVGAGYLYDDVFERNLWLSGDNVSGLRTDSLNISQAVAGGGFIKSDSRVAAPWQWNAGAYASTIMHLERFSMVGSFSFDQRMTYNDCGSMFISPGRYPVDVLEFTPGTKSRQNYAFTGGVSVDVSPSWKVGAELDFSATNCTKRKDLRYSDYALDLSLRPGVMWTGQSGVRVGVSLRIDRNTETIKPEQIGSAATSYAAFLDKGLMYGLENIWTTESLHLDENGIDGFPVASISYGGGLQFGFDGWFVEADYRYGNGKVGDKDAIWFRFPTHTVEMTLGKTFRTSSGTEHAVKIEGSFFRQTLREAIMDRVTTGGITVHETYGYNSIFERSGLSVKPSWKAFRPGVFSASASIEYVREDGVSAIKYPVLCGRTLNTVGASVSGRAFFGGWSLPVRISGGRGFESVLNRNEDAGVPYSQEEWRARRDILETSPRFAAETGVRYTFGCKVFVEALGNISTIGRYVCGGANLSVGYTF